MRARSDLISPKIWRRDIQSFSAFLIKFNFQSFNLNIIMITLFFVRSFHHRERKQKKAVIVIDVAHKQKKARRYRRRARAKSSSTSRTSMNKEKKIAENSMN